MSILRLSTLSLTLAIAVFALGYNPSLAKPKCDDPPCGGGGGGGGGGGEDPATDFMVEMQQGELLDDPDTGEPPEGLVTSNGVACGITKGELHNGVRFPEGCVTVYANFKTEPIGTDLILRAFTFGYRVNRLNARLFFTDGPIVFPDRNTGDGYGLNGVPVTISGSNGSITVKVNLSGLYAIKSHQLRKGDLVGPIAIGEIVYTPIK